MHSLEHYVGNAEAHDSRFAESFPGREPARAALSAARTRRVPACPRLLNRGFYSYDPLKRIAAARGLRIEFKQAKHADSRRLRPSVVRRELRAPLQAAAARRVAGLHGTAQISGGILRALASTLCVSLFALIGARLIEPGGFEAPGRSASGQHDHQTEQCSSHRSPSQRRSIWRTSRRRQESGVSYTRFFTVVFATRT